MIKNILTEGSQRTYNRLYTNPRIIGIHSTSDCNLNCDYCYSKHIKHMNINWLNIIEQAKKLKVKYIQFLGGEPFCDKNIIKYLNYCSDNNLHPVIFTNGMLITQSIIQDLQKIKHLELQIKFDTENNLNESIGKENYKKLIEIIKKCKSANINVSLHTFISKQNFDKIDEIVNNAIILNLPLSFERYISQKNEIDKKYKISSEEYNKATDRISELSKKDTFGFLLRATIKGNCCSCYVDAMFITSNGSVVPCPMSSEDQKIGDINKSSLKEIWKEYLKLKRIWSKIPEECNKCKFKLICHGGCKTNTFKEFKCYSHKDPLCNFSKIPTKYTIKQLFK